jgi:hypothetical protein
MQKKWNCWLYSHEDNPLKLPSVIAQCSSKFHPGTVSWRSLIDHREFAVNGRQVRAAHSGFEPDEPLASFSPRPTMGHNIDWLAWFRLGLIPVVF